ncbi:MAG: methyltransferase domain-containing protein [Phycisphaerae bacterium]|nr:methyltransferase domain-containing protein [Gemmatimonadaceae bacterium]
MSLSQPSGNALYNRIGIGYDNTRRADPYIAGRLASLLRPDHGGRYLDVACGTGNYSAALCNLSGASWFGCDQSLQMLRAAFEKDAGVSWSAANVEHLPFASGTFSGAICTNALHHFSDLARVLTDLRRLLTTGARCVVFSATREQMQRYWLNEYFPDAMARSAATMPTEAALLRAANEAGIVLRSREPYHIQPDLLDHFLYSGKHDPARYLDRSVRAAISTFAAHAAQDEVARGCQRLAMDIHSGRFDDIAMTYQNSGGDYAFWAFEAP